MFSPSKIADESETSSTGSDSLPLAKELLIGASTELGQSVRARYLRREIMGNPANLVASVNRLPTRFLPHGRSRNQSRRVVTPKCGLHRSDWSGIRGYCVIIPVKIISQSESGNRVLFVLIHETGVCANLWFYAVPTIITGCIWEQPTEVKLITQLLDINVCRGNQTCFHDSKPINKDIGMFLYASVIPT